MSDITSAFESMSTGLLVAIGALAVLELVLMVTALVSVLRRSQDELNGPKWLWILVVIFVNMIGPIVYFILGRKPEQVDVAVAQGEDRSEAVQSVADVLYGDAPSEDAQ